VSVKSGEVQYGIETVFQDLALVDELRVYHNLFLNREHTYGVTKGR
jgi:simple sugar transport system ATP-binding protein